MCGIFLSISRSAETVKSNEYEKIGKSLHRRGQDVQSEISIEFNGWLMTFIGHVLWTQGSVPTRQPLIDANGNILLWNGDVFQGAFIEKDDGISDSTCVLNFLSSNEGEACSCFSEIIGPYSFIYWDNRKKCLWFGRDVIGRHSLLWQLTSNHVIVSSVGNKCYDELCEVPALGIFMLNLENDPESLELNFFPWENCLSELICDANIPVNINKTMSHVVIGTGEKVADWLVKEPQDCHELKVYKMICQQTKVANGIFEMCLKDNEINDRVASLISVLSKSVEVRVSKQPGICRNCKIEQCCIHSKIGVLFSGGLDSTIIALLADKYVPADESVDLYNVSFQNPSKKTSDFNVPDRKTGRRSLEELMTLCPKRQWNFIEIDIMQEELERWRHTHISHLIHPLNTILDDSLGCALWFAARGQGKLNGHPYSSTARVVLLGMAADEMFGGYMRHRTQWRREQSWVSLAKSLANDLAIIGHRNLGRDNRIVADHGCQPRLPYLDENVVAFVQSLPPWKRCYLSDEMPIGVGDKLLLRLAAFKLGLIHVSAHPKRALQFGSRIANSHEKGNSISHRL